LHWKVKAILQKILATNSIGDRVNHLHGSLKKNYYSNGVEYGFNELFRKLDLIESAEDDAGINCNNALEIGTGYFLIQPIILKLLGWNRIITVDITRDLFNSAVRKQLSFLLEEKYLSKIRKSSRLDTSDFNNLLRALKEAKSLEQVLEICNIIYIAPYDFDDIDDYELKFNFIFSQVVLEHISPGILSELFRYTKKFLSSNGKIVHIVNFIDHFANPGFFCDKRISDFNFLQYSDKYWNFWAGNSLTYTNRLGYPYYYQLCEEHGLKVSNFIAQNYKERKSLDSDKIHSDVIKKYKKFVNRDELIKAQRGIFVITHR
jgi:hypothetical protein